MSTDMHSCELMLSRLLVLHLNGLRGIRCEPFENYNIMVQERSDESTSLGKQV